VGLKKEKFDHNGKAREGNEIVSNKTALTFEGYDIQTTLFRAAN
jgi:hypothetical protein